VPGVARSTQADRLKRHLIDFVREVGPNALNRRICPDLAHRRDGEPLLASISSTAAAWQKLPD
jgi:hypothetical protein